MLDDGQAAGDGTGGVNHAHPIGAGLAIERPLIVINPVGYKFERGTLGGRIAVRDGGQIAARSKLRGMAGDALFHVAMTHGGAKGDGTAARRVRKPRITHINEEVHTGTDSLLRIFVWGHRVGERAQLVRRMIRMNTDVIGLTGLDNASAEFVQTGIVLRRFNFIDGSAFGVWLQIAGLPASSASE